MSINYESSYRIYKLTADLDLSGYEWTNLGDFHGVFDGNGHKISNMRNVSTYAEADIYIGLFKSVTGLFKNLTIDNVSILVTLNKTSTTTSYFRFGAIAATTLNYGNFVCKNCNIQADVIITQNYLSESLSGSYYSYVGGIVGDIDGNGVTSIFDGCSSNITVELKSNFGSRDYYRCAGGISGNCDHEIIYIVTNCTITGNIKSKNANVTNSSYIPIKYYKNNTCDIYLISYNYSYDKIEQHITKLEDIDTLGQ